MAKEDKFRDDTVRDTNQRIDDEPVPAASPRDTNDEAGDVSSVADRQRQAEETEKKVGDAPSRHKQQANATFSNRRDAEMAVEQILQEHYLNPNAVSITPEFSANSTGTERSGGDIDSGLGPTSNPKLAGPLEVRVTISPEASKDKVLAALANHGGTIST